MTRDKTSKANWKAIHSLAEALRPLVEADSEALKKIDDAKEQAEKALGGAPVQSTGSEDK